MLHPSQAQPDLLVRLPINVRQDSEFTGAMLTRSISMLILRVSMASKSRIRQFPLTFVEKITIPAKLFDSFSGGCYALPIEKQAVNLFSPIRTMVVS